ncbi:MAG: universal stress protein [Kangiellaceae bacterium]|nr:universal stress protein [Kangiellaceae bacterium]
MYQLKHILAIVDFRQEKHYALPRAIELAKQFGCEITITANTYESFLSFIPTSSAIDHHQIKREAIALNNQHLRDLANRFEHKGLTIHCKTIWSKSFHRGLTEYINECDFDLVLKSSHGHNAIKKILFTPTDWHLLRDTKTNILFVNKRGWPHNSSIIGAINIKDDQQHQALNEKIIKTTVALANACSSKSNILNVFPWPMIQLNKFKYLFDKEDLFLSIKTEHEKQVNSVVDKVMKPSGKVIVAEGLEPEETIPEILKSTKSAMLVMGTVGRKGINAALIGNTAEKILDELECEVLAIK